MTAIPLIPWTPKDGVYIRHPQPGFFRLRVVKGGPWVGAVIWSPCPIQFPEDTWACAGDDYQPLDRPRILLAEIDGKPVSPHTVWISGEQITAREWRYLTEGAAWDRRYDPSAPAANPRRAVDLNELPPITPP